jgi:hypothetical protein
VGFVRAATAGHGRGGAYGYAEQRAENTQVRDGIAGRRVVRIGKQSKGAAERAGHPAAPHHKGRWDLLAIEACKHDRPQWSVRCR